MCGRPEKGQVPSPPHLKKRGRGVNGLSLVVDETEDFMLLSLLSSHKMYKVLIVDTHKVPTLQNRAETLLQSAPETEHCDDRPPTPTIYVDFVRCVVLK